MRSWLSGTVLHYVVRVMILLGLGYYILYLWKTDQMHYYIAPRMNLFILGSGVALLLMATHQFYLLVGHLLRDGQADREVADFDADANRGPSERDEAAVCDGIECNCAEADVPGHVRTDGAGGATFRWKQLAGYSLLMFPLMLALVLPETVLSSEIAAKKGMNLSSGALLEAKRAKDAEAGVGAGADGDAQLPADHVPQVPQYGTDVGELLQKKSLPTEVVNVQRAGVQRADGSTVYGGKNGVPEFLSLGDYDRDFAVFAAVHFSRDVIRIEDAKYMEYLTMFDLYLDEFVGKKVEVSGFVYREEGMTKQQFVVGRLAMSCCSADAAPYGVMAEYEGALTFNDNGWVRVTGVIDKARYGDVEILKLRVDDAVTIEPPKNQYVYPNYDFLY